MAGKKKDPEENEAIEKEKEKDPNNGSNYLALVANIMISILLMTVGLSMLFITGMKPLYYTYIVIGFLLVWGITCTVRYFAKEEFRIISNYDFAFGIIILILSACMILRANEVSSYFHLLLGCLALVEGVVLLQHTIQMKQLKGAAWFLNLLMSLALIAFSVITILNLKKILDPNSQAFYILLVAAGLLGILSQILVAIRARRFRKSETEEKTRKERKEEEKEKEQKQERLEDFEQNYGDSFSGGNTDRKDDSKESSDSRYSTAGSWDAGKDFSDGTGTGTAPDESVSGNDVSDSSVSENTSGSDSGIPTGSEASSDSSDSSKASESKAEETTVASGWTEADESFFRQIRKKK